MINGSAANMTLRNHPPSFDHTNPIGMVTWHRSIILSVVWIDEGRTSTDVIRSIDRHIG
jgi:hypothetical protein